MNTKAGFVSRYAAVLCASAGVIALGATPETAADGYLGEASIYAAPIDSRHLIIGLYPTGHEGAASVFTFSAHDRLVVSPQLRNIIAKVFFVPGQMLRIAPVAPQSQTLLFTTAAAAGTRAGITDIWLKDGVHLCRTTANGLRKSDFNSLSTALHCTADLGSCSTDSGDVIPFSC